MDDAVDHVYIKDYAVGIVYSPILFYVIDGLSVPTSHQTEPAIPETRVTVPQV